MTIFTPDEIFMMWYQHTLHKIRHSTPLLSASSTEILFFHLCDYLLLLYRFPE